MYGTYSEFSFELALASYWLTKHLNKIFDIYSIDIDESHDLPFLKIYPFTDSFYDLF